MNPFYLDNVLIFYQGSTGSRAIRLPVAVMATVVITADKIKLKVQNILLKKLFIDMKNQIYYTVNIIVCIQKGVV